jgi:hydroxymethylglutaryl-CoA synthase
MSTEQQAHGILSTSRYVPRLRLERSEVYAQHRWMAPGLKNLARGQRAMANWDEDTVTMSVEACRLLGRGAEDTQCVHSLTFASTSAPFVERINAGVVAAAAGLSTATRVRDVASSARAATTELMAALQADGPSQGAHIVVAAERRTAKPASAQELLEGDGAAAVVVGHGPVVATLVGAHTVSADFVDHFRETGQHHGYGWEERWVREEGYLKIAVQAVQAALSAQGLSGADVAHWVMPAPMPKINEVVAKRLGVLPTALTPTHHDTVGDLGAAQPLAMLDTALRSAQAGELLVVVAFGSGCDVLLLRRTSTPCPGVEPAPGKPETSYLKYLAFTGQLVPEWGMRAEMDNKTALTAAWRDHQRVARFEGGRCRHCQTVQFPGSRVCVNPACNAQDSQTPVSLAEASAKVLSHTSDFLAYTPHPPFQFGHIDFDEGGRVLMEFTDTDQDELYPGLPVRMVYRVKEFDPKRGFRRYFWKATPVRTSTPS